MDGFLFQNAPNHTKEEEKQLIIDWRNGDRDAMNRFLHGRARWIMSVVSAVSLPIGTDRDAVFADAFSEVGLAMKNFDIERGVSAYLTPVIRCAAMRSSGIPLMDTVECDEYPVEEPAGAESIVAFLHEIIEATPTDELNKTSRMLIRRIMEGEEPSKIAHLMGWSFSKSVEQVSYLRRYLAWRIVEAGISAAPWLSDTDLKRMAAEFEEERRKECRLMDAG